MGTQAHSANRQTSVRNMLMMKTSLWLLSLLWLASAHLTSHKMEIDVVPEDRSLCSFLTQNACASACAGQPCTETCRARCAVFNLPFSHSCQTVASDTCSTSTDPTIDNTE